MTNWFFIPEKERFVGQAAYDAKGERRSLVARDVIDGLLKFNER